MFKRILVAYDGSDGARAALALGIDLAKRLEAELCTVSVEEHLPRYAATISEVQGAKERIDAHFKALTKDARDNHVKRLIVVDEQSRFRGLVDRREVLRLLAAESQP
jgi:nucleotide-binding universal stress UspA family protein